MPFPSYVHSVIEHSDATAWPVQGQGENECGVTVAANALNLLTGQCRYDKDDFRRKIGLLFQRRLGGSPSPATGWLIRQHGGGTHFGNLRRTNAEAVLRALIDQRVPVVVELGTYRFGPFTVYGQHSVLLVGYSDPHPDQHGALHELYFFVDSQWPRLGAFDLRANDCDVNGNPTPMPGNRTIPRHEFLRLFQTGIYFPVFPSQAVHDDWYRTHMLTPRGRLLTNSLGSLLFTGRFDVWLG